MKLSNRLALVTGSTAGIGNAIDTSLAREGARVIVNGRSQASVDDVSKIKSAAAGPVQGFAGDLSTAAAAEKLMQHHPNIEILVNNLGIFEPKPFEEISDADWKRFFDVNVLSRLTGGRYLSLPRGDLARLIYRTVEHRFETIFGDSIARMDQDGAGVDVVFERAVPRRFDLVIGADGLHSAVRKLAFGNESVSEQYLGYVAAAFKSIHSENLLPE